MNDFTEINKNHKALARLTSQELKQLTLLRDIYQKRSNLNIQICKNCQFFKPDNIYPHNLPLMIYLLMTESSRECRDEKLETLELNGECEIKSIIIDKTNSPRRKATDSCDNFESLWSEFDWILRANLLFDL